MADLSFVSAPSVVHNLQYEAVWRIVSTVNRAAAFAVREHSGTLYRASIYHVTYSLSIMIKLTVMLG